MALSALPLVLDVAIDRACEYVKRGEAALEPAESAHRRSLLGLLQSLPICCGGLAAHVAADPRYVVLVAYERTRLGGAARSGYFLDGIGRGLSLFSGPTPVVLQPATLRHLTYREVLADRVNTIERLERLNAKDLTLLEHEHHLDDLPARLPARLHIFVSRARAVAQGLERVKPAAQFKACANRRCGRRFFTCPYVGGDTSRAAPQRAAGAAEPSYWALLSTTDKPEHPPRRFCTQGCYNEWCAQLRDAAPPDHIAFLEADRKCRTTGRARVAEALRHCVKRNEEAARRMRAIEKQRKRFPAIAREEVALQRRARIRLLNLDLGLVYAAAIIAESRTLSTGKVLPAAVENWRSRARFYAAAVRAVEQIYDRHHRNDAIVSNTLGHWPFLAKLRDRAPTIF